MKTFYIFKNEKTGQIFICIGKWDSNDAIILARDVDSGKFFIIRKSLEIGRIKLFIQSQEIPEKEMALQDLEKLLEIIKVLKEEGNYFSEGLDEEIEKLEEFFHIDKLDVEERSC